MATKTPKCERCKREDPQNVRFGHAATFRSVCTGCGRKVHPCCTTSGHTGKGQTCVDCVPRTPGA